jgi:hypothetical protein
LGVVLVTLFAIYYPEIKEYITTMFS